MAMGLVGCHLRNALLRKAGTCFSASQFRAVGLGPRKSANGAVRRGGGAFSKREEAMEATYFKKKEQELIEAMKAHHNEEIATQEKEIERLQEKIKWHQEKMRQITPSAVRKLTK